MANIILITGGGRGIGAATATLAAQRGYKVAINYLRDEQAAQLLVATLRAGGADAMAIQADVSREPDAVRLFRELDDAWGAPAVLVNNAGIVDHASRVDQMSRSRLERMFSVNVIGSMLCAREAVRRMSHRHGGRGGSIVNLSSAAAKHGSGGEYVDYAASKAAIDTFTLGLAREVAGEGIRVNAVRPGIITTEIHASGGDPARAERMGPSLPMQRAGHAEEVAHAILWLASPEASYCTGTVLDVSGGR
jgi:NAD(P)-dependent dehydrogenase (short-subunit alcohol dehydrogenase family)